MTSDKELETIADSVAIKSILVSDRLAEKSAVNFASIVSGEGSNPQPLEILSALRCSGGVGGGGGGGGGAVF